jgi:regulator of replication initiation timing
MSILDNAKQVAKAVEEIHNLELYQRVLNLHSDIIELVEENNRLRDEVTELKQKLELRAKMKFERPFYFQEGDATPHCAGCWEVKKQAIHAVKQWEEQGETKWECPACKQGYKVGTHRSHPSLGGHFDGSPWG